MGELRQGEGGGEDKAKLVGWRKTYVRMRFSPISPRKTSFVLCNNYNGKV